MKGVKRTKLKYSFEIMELDDQKVAIPVGNSAQNFRGVIKLNDSALEIFNLLSQDTTEDQVVAELYKKYGNDPSIDSYVRDAIEYFKSEGVLE